MQETTQTQLMWDGKDTIPPKIVKIQINDIKHPFYIRNHSSDVWMFQNVIVKQEYLFAYESPPKYIIDAGANIGMSAIWFANKFPEAKIIAIEPETSNYELLKENCRPYPNISTVHAAVWHKNGEIELLNPGRGYYGFVTQDSNQNSTNLVQALTIQQIMADAQINRIDLLKMDIEGAEKEVLENCHPWINKTSSLTIELHDRFKPGCSKSFIECAKYFNKVWQQGENFFISKDNAILPPNPNELFKQLSQ